jgi:hypothetical protein
MEANIRYTETLCKISLPTKGGQALNFFAQRAAFTTPFCSAKLSSRSGQAHNSVYLTLR